MNSPVSSFPNSEGLILNDNNITTVGGNLATHYHDHALAEGQLCKILLVLVIPLLRHSFSWPVSDLNALRPPANCSFNCVDIPSYHPGTRSKLLKKLDDWIRSNRPICWLKGPVGSGKTSIAQTFAKKCSEQNTLAANFFFDRNKPSGIKTLIPSLVYSMCISYHPAISYVEQVYRYERNIFQDSKQDYQFRRLLLEVLAEKSRMQFRSRLVIVIDGIDRCSDERAMRGFVKMLVGIPSWSGPKLLRNVRILLTGRIAHHFEDIRASKEFSRFVKEINIQDMDAEETTEDIQEFVQDRLTGIRRANSASSLTPEQLKCLVALSKGSFHFAQTILCYLDHQNTSSRLVGLLKSSNDRLYGLFEEVLNLNERGGVSSDFKQVLGTVMHLNSPLSINALRRICQIDPFPSLFQINALLSIPADDKQPIQPICEFLWEYLKALRDSRDYYFDGLSTHFSLAESCLEIIAQLSEGDEEPSCAEVQHYASIHWFNHLLECIKMSGSERLEEITELMHKSNVLEEKIGRASCRERVCYAV